MKLPIPLAGRPSAGFARHASAGFAGRAFARRSVGAPLARRPVGAALARRPLAALSSLAALAALAAAALPAAAHADSIVYIDQGNVWSAHPDGSGKVQLTGGGGWHSPTQADDGTLAAVQGTGPIQVMARDGRPLHTITTPQARSSDGGTFAARPVELSFSPDGSKLAYAYVANSCPVASTCGTTQRSTFYTASNVNEATPVAVYGNQFGVSNPEWVTNDRTLVFGGFGSQVSIDDLGPGDYSFKPWLTPNADMGDGEVSRDGKRLVTTFDYGADTILAFYAVKGDVKTQTPPPAPDAACSTTEKDPAYADPSWSPDGSGVATQDSAGIEVLRFSAFGPDVCALSGTSVLSATGSEPDWGPADPPAAAYSPAPPPAPAPAPAPGAPAPAATTNPPTPAQTHGPATHAEPARITVTIANVTVAALRKGLTIKVTTLARGKITATVSRGHKQLAKGAIAAKRAGTPLTIHLSKVTGAAALKHKTLTLKLTVNSSTATRNIKVR